MSTKTALKAAKAAIEKKDWDEARTQAAAVIEKDPKSYFAYLFLGRANHGLSRFDEAAKAYHDATKLKPEDPQAWLGLRAMYEGLKNAKVDENIDIGLELATIYMNLYVIETTSKEEG
jgi:cytochrome c-type biogenesis protein CcmH/NrfG